MCVHKLEDYDDYIDQGDEQEEKIHFFMKKNRIFQLWKEVGMSVSC